MAIKNLGRVVGKDGKSAYEIWLEQGNTGTEQDFLESLKGVDGEDYTLTETDKEDISKLVEVNIPTKVSQLENDSKYLSSIPLDYVTETDLSEKGYATENFVTNKIAEAELSGSDVDLSGLATKDELNNKVDKIKGKSLIEDTEIERLKNVTNYDDTELKSQINSKANKTDIPSKVSDLENDKNYITSIPSEYVTETELNNKGYLTNVPSDYKTKTENDNLYQPKGSYLTSYTETDPTVPSHVKSIKTTDISNWNSKSTFSGNYNDLTNKPTIPTVPTNISAFNNDKGYLTEIPNEYVKSVNNTLPDDKGNVNVTVTAEQPEFVVKDTMEEALEWLNENGDKSKKYVLPNGYIYAFAETVIKGETVPNFTNLMDNPNSYIKPGERYSFSGGAFKKDTQSANDCAIVIPIPETSGAFTIRIKEATIAGSSYYTSAYFGKNNQTFSGSNDSTKCEIVDNGKGTVTFTQKEYNGGYKYFVLHVANNVDEANLIVTLNEEITYTKGEDVIGYEWLNTGLSFTSNDYGDKITEIETTLTEHDDRIENLELNQVNGFSLEHSSCSIFRKVVCCGDSFTAGYIGTNNDNIIQTNYGFAWPSYLARLTGNEYVNCGHSGKDVLTWQTSAKGLPRAQAVGKAQAYIIGLGLNDASLVELGTPDDIGTNNQTYYGGMSKIIRELNAISPTAKIFVQTIPSDYVVYMNYSQAVRDVVNAYKDTYPVHLLDLYEYKALYKTSKLTKDAIMGHYSPIGYQQFAENLRYVWSDYINKNISKFQDVYLIPYDKTPDDIEN